MYVLEFLGDFLRVSLAFSVDELSVLYIHYEEKVILYLKMASHVANETVVNIEVVSFQHDRQLLVHALEHYCVKFCGGVLEVSAPEFLFHSQ